ncbi:hypothetical protein GDO81_017993 [Engystomops pustulosus]|uniref:Uncharacterized protein n=1 Tax=Engystomops pustulosus TaxID=76066 RepID=A0AAV7A3T4_ENGPU|nr:hypothetical protein GDO81_017993 [Engystomops pustulosus]
MFVPVDVILITYDSSLFDELSNLVDVDDFFEDQQCSANGTNLDNLDFTVDLMSWNSYPWDVPGQQLTGDIKPEPLSPASSNCFVQSPLPADSPLSTAQYVPEEVDISSSSQMSPVSLYSEPTRSPRSPDQLEEKPTITLPLSAGNPSIKLRKLAPVVPKPSVQPKIILLPTSTDIHSSSGIAPKPFILQPLTTLLPKQQPLITLQPTPQAGQQVLLTTSAVVQLSTPGIVASQPVLAVSGAPPPHSTPPITLQSSPVNSLPPTSIQTADCTADFRFSTHSSSCYKNQFPPTLHPILAGIESMMERLGE